MIGIEDSKPRESDYDSRTETDPPHAWGINFNMPKRANSQLGDNVGAINYNSTAAMSRINDR
jgi:hypothetical protein